jgi:hypothetical protein
MGTSTPATRQSADASIARFAGSPVTVVMPSRSHVGWASRYARQTASSMSEPMSVSSRIFSVTPTSCPNRLARPGPARHTRRVMYAATRFLRPRVTGGRPRLR